MSPARPQQTLAALLAGFANAPFEVAVSDVVLDSREATPGALFLACKGHQQHGLRYADEAVRRGAAAIVWEPATGMQPPQLGVPAIAVDDLSRRAGEIAARFWRQPSAQIETVGITGTDGKTSTAHLLAQAWTTLGRPCRYIGTLGHGRLGALDVSINTTPDAVHLQRYLAAAVAAGDQGCALEVSSHALVQGRINGVDFSAAVLTNVGRDHLDYHGSIDAYAAAKRRLFERKHTDAVILNRDDPRGASWARALADQHPVTVYGLAGERPSTPYAIGESLQLHSRGLHLDVASSRGKGQIDSRLLGRFNAYNLLAVVATLVQSGVSVLDACNALSQARTVPGRAEAFHGPGARPLVVVDYAHTPQALAQILLALRPHASGKLICVFGCGGDRDPGKRAEMGAAAGLADALVVTDDNPRSEDPAVITEAILAGVADAAKVQVIHDRGRAIRDTVLAVGEGDVVLVAGKGHETYQIYGDERRSFSDRAFVADLLKVGRPA